MKMNRLYFGVTLLFVMLFSSCGGGEDEVWYEFSGRWSIDNKTPHEFNVILDFMDKDENDELYVEQTLVAGVEANALSHISIPREWKPKNEYYYYSTFYSPRVYSLERYLIMSFEFPNGVCHTFTGDGINCDVRYWDNWVVSKSSVFPQLKGYSDHVYTFTQEDYDEIMALYE